jgi:hypothetical protein
MTGVFLYSMIGRRRHNHGLRSRFVAGRFSGGETSYNQAVAQIEHGVSLMLSNCSKASALDSVSSCNRA